MKNNLSTLEILFDNGGGTTLQTETYAHFYDDAQDAARDYMTLVNGGDTADWEGNDSYAQVTQYGGYRFYDHSEIRAIVTSRKHGSSWGNERVFFLALGVALDD